MTQPYQPPQYFDEIVTVGSGVAYASGGISLTVTKGKQVQACVGAPGDVTPTVAGVFFWQYAPGASGLGQGAQGGQTIQVRAFAAQDAASGAQQAELSSTNMSGRQIAVTYRGN